MICSCTSRGRWSQTSSAANGAFSRNAAPGAACSSTSILSRNSNWWQATKLARFDQVGRADRLRAEAQVRDRDRAGLLRVVDEVALRVAGRSPRR